jgi:hypothetical protein
MDTFTILFWASSLLFTGLSSYLIFTRKGCPIMYAQITAGFGMFLTSKIGRKFFGLD